MNDNSWPTGRALLARQRCCLNGQSPVFSPGGPITTVQKDDPSRHSCDFRRDRLRNADLSFEKAAAGILEKLGGK